GGRIPMAARSWPVGSDPVLGAAHREVFGDHDLETMFLRRLALERDESACVSRGDDARRNGRLHGRASAEKSQRLRYRDPILAEPMRNLLMGQPELFDQASQAACLLDRIEVGALQVFDQAEHQLLVVTGVTA